MNKPTFQEKPDNKFHLLPKPQQFATLQNYRDLRMPHGKFLTDEEDKLADKVEELFIGEVVEYGLSNEWMNAILNGRP